MNKHLTNLNVLLDEIQTVSTELLDAFEEYLDELVHNQICDACSHIAQAKEAVRMAASLQASIEKGEEWSGR